MQRFPKRDFVFIDESGDPGFAEGSSKYFAVGCLHVTDMSLEELHRHYANFTYFQHKLKEIKSSRLSRLQKDQISDFLKWLHCETGAKMGVAFINKDTYSGPYLKPDPRISQEANPYKLRNFLNRQLLERHFANHPPLTNETALIFDQMTAESDEDNLKKYLRGNFLLPNFHSIVQCDSRYVPALQFTDVLVHIVKEAQFGDPNSVDQRMLDYIDVYDVTHPQKRGRDIV